jgi:hypothetical protein
VASASTVAGPVLRLRQRDERVAARLGIGEAELLGHLEAPGEVDGRLLERQQAQRALAGGPAVVTRLLGIR